jgi:hypothetical protein
LFLLDDEAGTYRPVLRRNLLKTGIFPNPSKGTVNQRAL